MHRFFSNRRLLLLTIILVISNLMITCFSLLFIYHRSEIPLDKEIGTALVFSIGWSLLFVFLFVKILNPVLKTILTSEQQYRSLFENNHACMLLINPSNLKIIDANNVACKFYGYDRNKLISMKISDLNSLPLNQINLELSKAQSGKQNQFTFQHILSDGTLRDVDVVSGTVRINGEDLLLSVIYDITERRITQEALHVSEELYQKLFENMLNGLAYCKMIYDEPSLDFIYLIVNQTFESLTGLKNVSGKRVSEVIPGIQQTDQELLEIYARVALTGVPEKFEMYVQALEMWFLISVYCPKKEYFVAVFDVITERKLNEMELQEKNEEFEIQNEEYQQINEELTQTNQALYLAKEHAEESDRLKTSFLQNMSHEIRTPMNAIVGFSNILAQNNSDPLKVKEFSKIICDRSADLLNIINELLEISQIETNRVIVNKIDCDINALIEELNSFFLNYKNQLGKDHIELVYKRIIGCEHVIKTDAVKFNQVFINLIQNALKNTTKGTISFGFSSLDQNDLVFYVSDTGKGIPENKFVQIFERFMQIDPDSNTSKEGLGLGLSIVKSYIKLLGGRVWLKSELHHGTVFYFTIPYEIGQMIENTNDLNNFDEINNILKDKTILIVEDDMTSQEYFNEILRERTKKIYFATTGQESIDIMQSGIKIDLILMDIRLPDMSGFEATKKIKSIEPSVLIIAQTAYAMESDREKCLEFGCDGYISKPIYIQEFFNLLSKKLSA